MNNLSKNTQKILFMAFGILMFAALIFSVAYNTEYAHIKVIFSKTNGVLEINPGSTMADLGQTNNTLYSFILENHPELAWDEIKMVIYNYQCDMSSLNTFFVYFAIVGIVCFAAMLICSNHSRRIYYKSNLVAGIAAPLVTIVMAVVCIVRNISMMGVFNANYQIFNEVSVIQNPRTTQTDLKKGYEYISTLYPASSMTYILFTVLFAVIIIYSVVLMVLSIKKYKSTTELRNEVIRRAVENNG